MRKAVLFSAVAWLAVASVAAAHAGTRIGTTGSGGNHQRDHASSVANKSGDGAGGKSGASGRVSNQGTRIGTTGTGDGN